MKPKEFISRISNNKKAAACLKGIFAIALLTAMSTVSVHYLTGNTLSDYAEQNPELAYGTSEAGEAPGSSAETAEPENTSTETAQTTDIVTEDDTDSKSDTDTSTVSDIMTGPMVHFYDPGGVESGRTEVADGFYYEPLTDEMKEYITGTSWPDDDTGKAITLDDLNYVGVKYHDFSDVVQAGEIICSSSIAQDLAEIFSELYDADYRFEKIVLVDNYGGDDTASMAADNTSCFNYRVVDGSSHLSNHAYGLAIDINPFYNPYVVFGGNDDGSDYISPAGSEVYTDREASFPYKIDPDDLCYRLFTEHGFTWGGNWNSCKDYQHFEKAN